MRQLRSPPCSSRAAISHAVLIEVSAVENVFCDDHRMQLRNYNGTLHELQPQRHIGTLEHWPHTTNLPIRNGVRGRSRRAMNFTDSFINGRLGSSFFNARITFSSQLDRWRCQALSLVSNTLSVSLILIIPYP